MSERVAIRDCLVYAGGGYTGRGIMWNLSSPLCPMSSSVVDQVEPSDTKVKG